MRLQNLHFTGRKPFKKKTKLYRDVGLVDVVLASLLGNEEHPLEEEEAASVLGSQDMKGAFQHQLPIGGQVRTLPIDQKRLDLLQAEEDTHRHTSQECDLHETASVGKPAPGDD